MDIIIIPKKKIIGILLDISSSMRGRKIDNAKIAIEKVLDKIPIDVTDNIRVVFTIFSTDLPENHQDIISYGIEFDLKIRKRAIEILRKIQAGGGTPLYQAINKFMDDTWSMGALDKDKIFFPYTYLIIVSDGEDNQPEYREKKDKDKFFAKLEEYRSAGLITEIIPFAYGEMRERDIQLMQDLKDISGKTLINEVDPTGIIDILTKTVDDIIDRNKSNELYRNISNELLGINITLDTPSEIVLKLINIRKGEKDILEHNERLKDRIFLKNLLDNIEEIVAVKT